MRVLFATSEAAPFSKSGGLADVSRALPDALTRLGLEVLIIHPYYRTPEGYPTSTALIRQIQVPWGGGSITLRYLREDRVGPEPGRAPTIFVDQPYFFYTTSPYAPTRFDQLAPGRRFALFSRAVVEWAKYWGADLIHLNDWPTGLVPLYTRLGGVEVPTLFTIHNLGYQGNFDPVLLREIGVPPEYYRIEEGLEFFGTASFLKSGLALSDSLNTVSPTYSREIQTPEYGAGFDGLLTSRRDRLSGILNGIDTEHWDPLTDPALPANYGPDDPSPKAEVRTALVEELDIDGGGPLIAVISRLVEQKGIDLLIDSLDELLRLGLRLIVLGTGEDHYEKILRQKERETPERVRTILRFDEPLARRIYAGSDLFLMPSIYEPSGLGQMIAQRYGTPPIVRETGGLADSVHDQETGFTFEDPTGIAMVAAIDRAVRFREEGGWGGLRDRCMRLDNSWHASAQEYLRLYEATIESRERKRLTNRPKNAIIIEQARE